MTVLLDENGNVKIIDFGFANIMRENTLLETFCGSAAYAAPEMIGGKKYIGTQIDAWAFGVILYVIVCGQLPFDDKSMSRMFLAIMSGKYTFPDFVSAGKQRR
jgi:serine/threonine protein kinase